MSNVSNKSRIKTEQVKIVNLQAFDSSYFCGESHFEDVFTQNYLEFQPMYKYFKKICNTDHISAWKSKGLSDESIKSPSTSVNSLAPSLTYIGTKRRVKFVGSCLKQDEITFIHKNSKYIHCL